MLTQEEYQIMKNQLISMADENEEIENKIQKLQAQNSQIPLLERELSEREASLRQMEDDFEKEQLELTSQFSQFGQNSEVPKNNDLDNKLSHAKDALGHAQDYLGNLGDQEAQIAEQLGDVALRDNELQILIEEANKFFLKYDVIVPQLQACRMTGILLEDLHVQVEKLKIAREAQHGRRFRLNGWKQQALEVNNTQRVACKDIEEDFKEKLEKLNKGEEELSKVENQKAILDTKISELTLEETQASENVEILAKESKEEIEKSKKDLEEIKRTYEKNKTDISEMESTIQNYKRSEKKAIQKKAGIARDLEKRLIQERNNLPRVAIDSPVVEELTRTIDAEMREREAMLKSVKKLEKGLKRVQEEAARKAQVIEEFSIVPPFDEPTSDERCYAEFLNLVKETEIKHLNFVSDLQGIAELLACTEQENDVLRETLREISGN